MIRKGGGVVLNAPLRSERLGRETSGVLACMLLAATELQSDVYRFGNVFRTKQAMLFG